MMVKNDLYLRLKDKSIEALLVAIELYNKPTIKYRIEGFSFMICNAWELLLKAYIIKNEGELAIYYSDKPDRSISLETAVKKIFTNEKYPMRLNIEKIIELRNTATHFIVTEYETLYTPLFQACILNYTTKLSEFFDVDIEKYIQAPFLTLVTSPAQFNESAMLGKYGVKIVEKYKKTNEEISNLVAQHNNDKLAIGLTLNLNITKKPKDADFSVRLVSDADTPALIFKEVKDVSTVFPYNQKRALEEINKELKKRDVVLPNGRFTSHGFGILATYFKIVENPDFCYIHKIDKTPRKTYSRKLVDMFVSELTNDPNIVNNIKSMYAK